jgi:hypothetical protein
METVTSCLRLRLGFDEWTETLRKRPQFLLDDFPDNVGVDAPVFMNNAVAHPDNAFPRDVGEGLPKRLGQLSGRLSDRSKEMRMRQLQRQVLIQV